MPDLQRIGRNGPGPQSFTMGQHQQQKPVGSCLTFKQLNCSNGKPQYREPQQLKREPQCSHSAGEPQQFQHQPQQRGSNSAGEP